MLCRVGLAALVIAVAASSRVALGAEGEGSSPSRAEPAKAAAKPKRPPPELPHGVYSPYERQTMTRALERHEVEVDQRPEGKIIEEIAIEVLDVIEDRDPLPNFLNLFHCTTRQRAVARDLLFNKGQRYEASVMHETERNLRSLRQHSLVLVVPIKGSASDRVRVLVLVKDVWSLRLNTGFRITGRGVEYFLVQPSEENLMGMHRSISTQFIYDPATVSFGGRLIEPRLADSRVQVIADVNAIVNHRTREVEGSFGTFEYGVPLYSTRQQWAWGAKATWKRDVTRRFSGTNVAFMNATGSVARDDECTDATKCVPMIYNSDELSGSFSVTRSFGRDVKQDVVLGVAADRRSYTTPDLSGYDPAVVGLFVDRRVPLSDTRNGPFALYHVYTNRYTHMLDVETLGLQESFRLGPDAYARFYPVAEFLGSKRNLLGFSGSASYTQRLPDALARIYAAGGMEVKPSDGAIFNASLQGGLRLVSPRFFIGRMIYDGTFHLRLANSQKSVSTLGGDGRLRGYLSGVILGQSFFSSNVEFRSRSVQLWTFQLGGALFYDVGDAFDSLATFRPKQGLGFGLRLGFPQLERSVMRIDWGFPLTKGVPRKNIADGLIVTFHQAFGMPQASATGVSR